MSAIHKRRKEVRDRLIRAEGHIRGIIKMIDEEKECPDILIQIGAVKAALEKAGLIILEDHIEHCLVEAVKSGDVESQLDELKAGLEKLL
ncbi:MAG: metal-sensitive transcriptional regulator [Candidatus Bathyarchaeota archaeon]|jgi:DNA-binding FrmR family transcriptional regulator|nr:metal-sensitive transcriptional regulator [Candidatus Bathyarchaeota archaeon]